MARAVIEIDLELNKLDGSEVDFWEPNDFSDEGYGYGRFKLTAPKVYWINELDRASRMTIRVDV